ncbi:hypothetical protein SAFG77S_12279 [Streptomyces afghaniensis]
MGSAVELQVLADRRPPAVPVRALDTPGPVEHRAQGLRPLEVEALAVAIGEIRGGPSLLLGPEQLFGQGVPRRTRDDVHRPRLGVAVRGGRLCVFQHAADVRRGQGGGQELPGGASGAGDVGEG